jgi:hypothetical protein
VFNHVGNRRFRVSLALWIPRYDEAQTKSEKAAVIGSLCHMLKNEAGVRFLKKYDGGPGREDYYIELNSSQTKKKVGHAIRDMSVARKEVSQRRSSARKASRTAKLRKSSSGQDDSSSTDDDDASSSSQPTEIVLSDSLTALLPFVSHDPHGENDTSMEPLPFDGVAQESESIGAFVSHVGTTSEQSLHPPSFNPTSTSILKDFSTASSVQASLPSPSHLLRSNTFPGPPSYYHANHYHYHYHQYYQPNQVSGLMPGLSSFSGNKELQLQQQQPLRPPQNLYSDSSFIQSTSETMQFFESTDSSTQQPKQQQQQDPSNFEFH